MSLGTISVQQIKCVECGSFFNLLVGTEGNLHYFICQSCAFKNDDRSASEIVVCKLCGLNSIDEKDDDDVAVFNWVRGDFGRAMICHKCCHTTDGDHYRLSHNKKVYFTESRVCILCGRNFTRVSSANIDIGYCDSCTLDLLKHSEKKEEVRNKRKEVNDYDVVGKCLSTDKFPTRKCRERKNTLCVICSSYIPDCIDFEDYDEDFEMPKRDCTRNTEPYCWMWCARYAGERDFKGVPERKEDIRKFLDENNKKKAKLDEALRKEIDVMVRKLIPIRTKDEVLDEIITKASDEIHKMAVMDGVPIELIVRITEEILKVSSETKYNEHNNERCEDCGTYDLTTDYECPCDDCILGDKVWNRVNLCPDCYQKRRDFMVMCGK